jgi:hypothetical protein
MPSPEQFQRPNLNSDCPLEITPSHGAVHQLGLRSLQRLHEMRGRNISANLDWIYIWKISFLFCTLKDFPNPQLGIEVLP